MKWIAMWALLVVLYPFAAWSAPIEVTFFPDSAQVSEVTKVKLQAEGKDMKKAVFVIPSQADPDTLLTGLPEGSMIKIEDQTWRQIDRQDNDGISKIKKQLENLKSDKRILRATLQSLKTQIEFWQLQTKAKSKTLTDVHNMSAAIGKNMKKIYHDMLNQELESEQLDKKIKELQDELERMVGKKETAWEITTLLSGVKATETTLKYTYFLSGCGWLPLYRLEAVPGKGKISFSWEAEIWQSSGREWSQVVTHLATLKPSPSLSPSELPPWIIKPRPEIHYHLKKSAVRAKSLGDNDEAVGAALEAPSPAAPQQVRQSTYAVWQIGRKNIAAGVKQRVKLQEEAWPAEFSYLIRPGVNSRAFVRASVRFTEGKEIPSGAATFLIDGAILGKRNFSLAGQEEILFFGVEPLVKADRTLISKKSGERGILKGKQSYSWQWRIDVTNGRSDVAKVVIEEPNPQSRDERITLTMKHDPEPLEKTPLALIWNLDVAPGQKKSISSHISLEAPGDMKLDMGWQK